jgi:hypothetical protein
MITIQETAKDIKATFALGIACMIFGLMLIFLGDEVVGDFGCVFGILGLIMTIAARIAKWWHHA